jgi:hypothetical protein
MGKREAEGDGGIGDRAEGGIGRFNPFWIVKIVSAPTQVEAATVRRDVWTSLRPATSFTNQVHLRPFGWGAPIRFESTARRTATR